MLPVDGRIYVFGGTDRRRRQQDLYQFDIGACGLGGNGKGKFVES
jgi:hypothetical protein